MNNTRGSEWGKWDSQVQTILDDGYVSLSAYADDLKNQDEEKWDAFTAMVGGEENALLFDSKSYFGDEKISLEERCGNYAATMMAFLQVYKPELVGIVLTDHNYFHEKLADSLFNAAKQRLPKIIPGVEINVGGVHLLVAFDEIPFKQKTYSAGIKSFLGKIDIDSRTKENGSLTVTQKDITEVIDLVNDNNGLVIFPHCNTDNGLFQERQKTDRENLADIFNHQPCNIIQTQTTESASKLNDYIEKNENLTSEFCITIASDSRCLKDIGSDDSSGNNFWVKAEPGYSGLEQLHHEPKDRAFIGVNPAKVDSVSQSPSKYIDYIEVQPRTKTQYPMFSQRIELNPGLVAIIGKKGSGKSGLTDMIALLGKSHAEPSNYSFLTSRKFRKRNLAASYKAEMGWVDGEQYEADLMKDVDTHTEPERVKYLPQKYVESICDDFGVSKTFQDEINRVIFSYVPEEKRLGRSNLDELIEYKSKSIDTAVMQMNIRLNDKNVEIEKLEKKLKPDYRSLMREKLEQKEKELKNLKSPPKVSKPKKENSAQTQIDTLNKQIIAAELVISQQEERLKKANDKLSDVKVIESQIDNIEPNLKIIETDIEKELGNVGLKFKDIVTLKIDKTKLRAENQKLSNEITKIEVDLGKKPKPNGATKTSAEKLSELVVQRDGLKSQLTKADTQYQNYLDKQKVHEATVAKLTGTKDDGTLESIESIKAELAYLATDALSDHKQLISDRDTILDGIFTKKNEKISFYEEIYKPLIELLEKEKQAQEDAGSVLSFKVEPVFDKQKFIEKFERLIDQGARGNFRGKDEGIKKLVDIIDTHDFNSAKSLKVFNEEVLDALYYVGEDDKREAIDLDAQLLNVSRSMFYNFLYGLDALEVKYNLRFNGKELSEDQFSPGEKGALLLIFYLLIEQGKIPLIIDQPEENLDNESVFDLLVPYIKEAKKERQVILVTHNPNLAVVCDAEQIIHAKMDKKNNTVIYTTGALENANINIATSNVLEGTLKAFDVRNSKYKRF